MADKPIVTKITCAAGRHPANAYSGINDLPLLPLCYEHRRMAYDNPEQLMQLVKAHGGKRRDSESASGV